MWTLGRFRGVVLAAGATVEVPIDVELGTGTLQVINASTGQPAVSTGLRIDRALSARTDTEGNKTLTLITGSHKLTGSADDPFAGGGPELPANAVPFDWGPEGPVVKTIHVAFPE